MNKEAIFDFYNKYKIYIFPAVVSASSLFLIVFAIYPQTSKLITNQKIQGELKARSDFLEVKAKTLEDFDVPDLSRKVEYALYSYPQDKDFGNVIGLLQLIGARSNFLVNGINLEGGSSKAAGAQSYNVRMEVNGAKSLLPLFLSNIESSVRLMKVNSIDVSGKNDQSTDVVLGIEILYSPLPLTFGSIDSPLPKLSEKDEELLTTLGGSVPSVSLSEELISARGKANPFE